MANEMKVAASPVVPPGLLFLPTVCRHAAMPSLPQAVGLAAACVVGRYLYVVVGETDFGTSLPSNFLRMDLAALAAWEALPPMPQPRSGICCAAVDQVIYVFGGYNDANYGPFNTVNSFDTILGAWRAEAPMATALSAAACAAHNGKIFVFGGSQPMSAAFDTATRAWVSLAPMPNSKIGHSCTVVTGLPDDSGVSNTSIYCVGGCTDTPSPVDFAYDVDKNVWSTIPAAPTSTILSEGIGHTGFAITLNLWIFLFGATYPSYIGYQSPTFSGVVAFNTLTGTWFEVPQSQFTNAVGSCCGAAQLVGNVMTAYLVGGTVGMSNPQTFVAGAEYFGFDLGALKPPTPSPPPNSAYQLASFDSKEVSLMPPAGFVPQGPSPKRSDERVDYHAIPDPERKALSRCAVKIVPRSCLKTNPENPLQYIAEVPLPNDTSIPLLTFEELLKVSNLKMENDGTFDGTVHPGIKFLDQTIIEGASGFLVARDIVCTCFHALQGSPQSPSQLCIILDYVLNADGTAPCVFQKENVYCCESAPLKWMDAPNPATDSANPADYKNYSTPDWAFLKLDRKVPFDIPIAEFAAFELDSAPTGSPTNLWTCGYPAGLPMKYGEGQIVTRASENQYAWSHSCIAGSGHSGSPIFNNENKVVGMHYSGPPMYRAVVLGGAKIVLPVSLDAYMAGAQKIAFLSGMMADSFNVEMQLEDAELNATPTAIAIVANGVTTLPIFMTGPDDGWFRGGNKYTFPVNLPLVRATSFNLIFGAVDSGAPEFDGMIDVDTFFVRTASTGSPLAYLCPLNRRITRTEDSPFHAPNPPWGGQPLAAEIPISFRTDLVPQKWTARVQP